MTVTSVVQPRTTNVTKRRAFCLGLLQSLENVYCFGIVYQRSVCCDHVWQLKICEEANNHDYITDGGMPAGI